jgi:hypothetical protein
MTLDAFIEAAWADHGDHAPEVAQRLADSVALVVAADQIGPYATLVAHVCGEHLGEWERGIGVLQALRASPACRDSPASFAALARHEAALRYASGDTPPFDALPNDQRVAALAAAAAMLAGRGEWVRAIRVFDDALEGAADGLPAKSAAIRALAVAGNNLAAALEEKTDRSTDQTRAMLTAVQAGLTHWRRAGTWLEVERAEYRMARSCLQVGDADAALQSALRCVAVCETNRAPAMEWFFGEAVLALAQRATGNHVAADRARRQAREWFAQVPVDERACCEGDLAELAT